MSARNHFGQHRHLVHQLVWTRRGVLTVQVEAQAWFLPSIPAGLAHLTRSADHAWMRSPYFLSSRCPIPWSTATVVAVGPLLRELLDHLAVTDLPPAQRIRAEAVLFDLLHPMPAATLPLPMPTEPRARRVADCLVADPTDDPTVARFATDAGVSARTLRRTFAAQTGMTFEQWRRHARLRAAMPALAAGVPVSTAARRAGYATPSAFVAAFCRAVGVPPGVYFTHHPSQHHPPGKHDDQPT
ncbi:AraC family transcriptional regulator [Frankia sp. AiPs1]|uniref:helix-turn-helix domain-containing protein n=1 Tax=Frankia sp. AiPs1 TaxID=573493 RepID=UPI0020445018|nr:AraC family transcriptional regulator [Frankia sp. AiPs1]MCM3922572.1 AraC family transcriptional regulator [Frankia sp. AiPs1]